MFSSFVEEHISVIPNLMILDNLENVNIPEMSLPFDSLTIESKRLDHDGPILKTIFRHLTYERNIVSLKKKDRYE